MVRYDLSIAVVKWLKEAVEQLPLSRAQGGLLFFSESFGLTLQFVLFCTILKFIS